MPALVEFSMTATDNRRSRVSPMCPVGSLVSFAAKVQVFRAPQAKRRSPPIHIGHLITIVSFNRHSNAESLLGRAGHEELTRRH